MIPSNVWNLQGTLQPRHTVLGVTVQVSSPAIMITNGAAGMVRADQVISAEQIEQRAQSTSPVPPEAPHTIVIVLDGSSFTNIIPPSEFNPLPVPTTTALAIPAPFPAATTASLQVTTSIGPQSLSMAPISSSSPPLVTDVSNNSSSLSATSTQDGRTSDLTFSQLISVLSAAGSGATPASTILPSSDITVHSSEGGFLSSIDRGSSTTANLALTTTGSTIPGSATATTISRESQMPISTTIQSATETRTQVSSSTQYSGPNSTPMVASTKTVTTSRPGSTVAPPNNGDSAAPRSSSLKGGKATLFALISLLAILNQIQIF